ncbi:MAG: hypothetical protein H0X37_12480 [Herpetosiphonaceae bacterium]|nr:hypothetical protein [Herpetosiphonaceae bacterium]
MATERQYTDDERARYEEEVARLRREELPRVREEEIRAAAQRTVAREVEIERDVYRDELDSEVERTAVETPQEDRIEALRTVPSQLLIGLLLLLILALIISVTRPGGLSSFFHRGATTDTSQAADTKKTLAPILGPNGATNAGNSVAGAGSQTTGQSQTGRGLAGDAEAGGIDAINSVHGLGGATVDPLFWPNFSSKGGVPVCGLPLAPAQKTQGGRTIQWFERCRLEAWPEYANTENQVQRGLLGSEFTGNRPFPTQQYFVSQPGYHYFAETSHAVAEPFLSFWEQNGGLAVFGYPISEVVMEELEDGNIHHVQYFQRARMEEHLESPGHQVMLGLVGRALYLHEPQPKIVPPLQPTPLPLP